MEEITEINISYVGYPIEEKICLLISEITFFDSFVAFVGCIRIS